MIFRIMLNSKCGIIGEASHENLHIIRHYAKLQLIDFMANITLKDITPIHFLNTVKLLKADDYRVYCTLDTIEIRFETKRFYTREETQARFDLCDHLAAFLSELRNSSVPIDKEEFIQAFSPIAPKPRFYRRK